jgi:hypothetical protein
LDSQHVGGERRAERKVLEQQKEQRHFANTGIIEEHAYSKEYSVAGTIGGEAAEVRRNMAF